MPIISREEFLKLMNDFREGVLARNRLFGLLDDKVWLSLSRVDWRACFVLARLLGEGGDLFINYYYNLGWDEEFSEQEQQFGDKVYHVKDWGDFYDMISAEYHGTDSE